MNIFIHQNVSQEVLPPPPSNSKKSRENSLLTLIVVLILKRRNHEPFHACQWCHQQNKSLKEK